MNSIVIIGLGLMGGSVAKALKNKNTEIVISAFDHNDSALDLALDVGIIDKKISTLEEINNLEPKDADIIIIANPWIRWIQCRDQEDPFSRSSGSSVRIRWRPHLPVLA